MAFICLRYQKVVHSSSLFIKQLSRAGAIESNYKVGPLSVLFLLLPLSSFRSFLFFLSFCVFWSLGVIRRRACMGVAKIGELNAWMAEP